MKTHIGKRQELAIHGLAAGGDGVGRLADGRVCFVPRSAPGDRLHITISQEKRRFLRGEIAEILTPGPFRRDPFCPRFDECGGCAWLHIAEAGQHEAKRAFVSRALGLSELPLVPSPVSLGYRVVARLHGSPGSGGKSPRLGFARIGGGDVMDIRECPVMDEALSSCLPALAGRLKGVVRCRYEVRILLSADGPVVVVSSDTALDEGVYRAARLLESDGFVGVFVNIHGSLSQLTGPEEIRIEGSDGLPFVVSPSSFGQVNREVNRLIGRQLSDWIAHREFRSALELFGGAGNHSVVLAPHVERYLLSELDLRACDAALKNLALRGLTHVAVEGGEALGVYLRSAEDVDLIVLNPPRQGHRSLCESLAKGRHRGVLYVSCNPATLGRDLDFLRHTGYRLEAAAAFDMFPQTAHVETAVLMTR